MSMTQAGLQTTVFPKERSGDVARVEDPVETQAKDEGREQHGRYQQHSLTDQTRGQRNRPQGTPRVEVDGPDGEGHYRQRPEHDAHVRLGVEEGDIDVGRGQ